MAALPYLKKFNIKLDTGYTAIKVVWRYLIPVFTWLLGKQP